MDLIQKDWKHLLETENFQKKKITFKTLYHYKDTRKVKDF